MKHAHDLTDIRAEGSPPFRLVARVFTYDEKGASKEGSYTLIWKTPTSWRDEIRFADFLQVRVAAGSTLYLARSEPGLSLDLFELRWLMDPALLLQGSPDSEVRTLRKRGEDQDPWIAFTRKGIDWRKIDLDPAIPVPKRVISEPIHYEFQFAKYAVFAGRRYPTVLTRIDHGKVSLRVEVKELLAETPDESALGPLKEALALPWCPDKKPAVFQRFEGSPLLVSPSIEKRRIVVYGIVGVDGRWHNVEVMSFRGDETSAKRSAMLFTRAQRYDPATCGGKPVPEESVVVLGP